MKKLVDKSLGQFIYASTVINYVSSIRHKPTDRLDIIFGIRPPRGDLPFAELDALYMHILASVDDIEPVLEILSFLLFGNPTSLGPWNWDSSQSIENFLALRPGDVDLYLGDLNSLVNIGPKKRVYILHASLTDFLADSRRSKEFWINPCARHTAFARRCLQLLQCKGKQPGFSHNNFTLTSKKNMFHYCGSVFTTQFTISKMRN